MRYTKHLLIVGAAFRGRFPPSLPGEEDDKDRRREMKADDD